MRAAERQKHVCVTVQIICLCDVYVPVIFLVRILGEIANCFYYCFYANSTTTTTKKDGTRVLNFGKHKRTGE